MAAMDAAEAIGEPDQIDGIPLPRETENLIGHEEAERELLEAYRSQRFHHAWLIGGPEGIGKATLAFRFARFVLANPDRRSAAVASALDLSVDPASTASHKVAVGSHPDLLYLRRPYDFKTERFKQALTVAEVRKTVSFFGKTSAGGQWRVCIVDAADDMNPSAANALLKILEEPPANSIFLVLSHAPGRLLPTIRSRCRSMLLRPLGKEQITTALTQLLPDDHHSAEDLALINRIADGSLRRAIQLVVKDGLDLARQFEAIVAKLPESDVIALHRFADSVAATGAGDAWSLFVEMLAHHLHTSMKREATNAPGNLVRWSEVWEKTSRAVSEAEALNLDKKQVVLSSFRHLAEANRMGG